jgi:hypothetical protein
MGFRGVEEKPALATLVQAAMREGVMGVMVSGMVGDGCGIVVLEARVDRDVEGVSILDPCQPS